MPSKTVLTSVAFSVLVIAILNQFDSTSQLISGGRRFFN